jgi:hypothetical protein
VANLKLVDLLNGKLDKVFIEKAESKHDKFDDVKCYSKDHLFHYQVKYGPKNTKLKIKDFLTTSKQKNSLYIGNLFKAWLEIDSLEKSYKNHLYIVSNKTIKDCDKLLEIVEKVDVKNLLVSSSNVYKFKTVALDRFSEILNEYDSNIRKQRQFFDSLFIELNLPFLYSTKEDYQTIGDCVKEKMRALGLERKPHKRNLNDLFSNLFMIANNAMNKGEQITKENLLEILDISDNLNAIPQNFLVEKTKFVQKTGLFNRIIRRIKVSSGKILVLVGKPGVGKSWLLTQFTQHINKINLRPMLYYCHISPSNDSYAELRITAQQLVNNLVHEINLRYSDVLEIDKYPSYAADESILLEMLDELGKFAKSRSIIIPIIIDGLDHVTRVRSSSQLISNSEEDISAFVRRLKIPEGICLIIGSQPFQYDASFENDHSFIDLEGFNASETRSFLKKWFGNIDGINIQYVLEKTSGLPLLLSILTNSSSLSLEKFMKNVSVIPITNGEITNYYNYLWKSLKENHITVLFARMLALLKFPVSLNFFMSLYPSKEFVGETGFQHDFSPLLPIIKRVGDLIELFHESFKRFVSEDVNFDEDKRLHINEIIYKSLKPEMYEKFQYFDFILEYAIDAQLWTEINDLVSIEFVNRAVDSLLPFHSIYQNLDIAYSNALKLNHITKIVELGLVKKYTFERFLYNIDYLVLFECTFLINDKNLLNLFLRDHLTQYDSVTFVHLLARAMKKHLNIEYGLLFETRLGDFDLFEHLYPKTEPSLTIKHNENVLYIDLDQKDISKKSFLASDYFLLYKKIYGFNKCFKMMEKLDEMDFIQVCKSLAKYCHSIDLEVFSKSNNSEKIDLLRCYTLLEEHSIDECRTIVLQYLHTSNIKWIEIAILSKVNPKNLESIVANYRSIDITNVSLPISNRFFHLINYSTLLNYCNRMNELNALYNNINLIDGAEFSNLFKCAVYYGVLQVAILNKEISQSTLDLLFYSIKKIIYSNQFNPFIAGFDSFNAIIISSLNNYFSYSNQINYNEILSLPFYSRYTEGRIGFIELITILLNNRDDYNKEEITKTIYAVIDRIKKSDSHFVPLLKISIIFWILSMQEESKRYYYQALRSTHSYGSHKDMLLYEWFEIVRLINIRNKKNSFERTLYLFKISQYLGYATDEDETMYFPGEIIGELSKIDANKTGQIIIKLSEINSSKTDSWEFIHAVGNFITFCDGSILLRFLLCELLPVKEGFRNDSSWHNNIKINLLETSISNKSRYSNIILNRIRNSLKDNRYNHKRTKDQFDALAKELGQGPLEGNILDNPIPYIPTKLIHFANVEELLGIVGKVTNVKYYENPFDYYKSVKKFIHDNIQSIKLEDSLLNLLILKEIDVEPEIASKLVMSSDLEKHKLTNFLIKMYEFRYGGNFMEYWRIEQDPNISLLTFAYSIDKNCLLPIVQMFVSKTIDNYQGNLRALGFFFFKIKKFDLLNKLERMLKNTVTTLFANYDYDLEINQFLNNIEHTRETTDDILIRIMNKILQKRNIVIPNDRVKHIEKIIILQPLLSSINILTNAQK